MMDQRIKSALDKLEHGGWSLTVAGFARRALKMKLPMSAKDRAEATRLMHATGLGHRRVKYGTTMIDVWDYQKP